MILYILIGLVALIIGWFIGKMFLKKKNKEHYEELKKAFDNRNKLNFEMEEER